MNHHEKYPKHENMPDPQQIKEILDVVSEKVTDLHKELSKILYGQEEAKQIGAAIAIFYKELRDSGMTDEQAFQLTQQYMSTLNVGKMMGGLRPGHKHHDD